MAAGKGFANLSTYSASRASASAGSRKIIETAPLKMDFVGQIFGIFQKQTFAPMTATSAVGHA